MELYLFNRCKIRDKRDSGHKYSFILDTHFEPTRNQIFLWFWHYIALSLVKLQILMSMTVSENL